MNNKPILTFDESFQLFATTTAKRYFENSNTKKSMYVSKKKKEEYHKLADEVQEIKQKTQNSHREQCTLCKSCEWANKIINVCCMPACMKEIIRNGKK